MSRIILVAESGSDLTPEMAAEHGITIVPMHVSFGGKTYDDGSIPLETMFTHYATTKELPRTSGSTPHDFEVAFNRLLNENPQAKILHLAYSSVTTCSMQSALIAAEGEPRIVSIDTKSVAAAQAAIVLRTAAWLEANPEAEMEQACAYVQGLVQTIRMGFIPGDLDYLRAGGRVSNAAYLGAKILSLHPMIEILDGKLISTKKYRGNKEKVVLRMTQEYPQAQQLDMKELYLIYNNGLDEGLMRRVEEQLKAQGCEKLTWVCTGCVIAAHSGPGAFGIVGFAKA